LRHLQKQFIEFALKFKEINFNLLKKKPLLIVISGPSGVGKDSVVRTLKQQEQTLHFVVTANTRKPRVDEVEGVDYFFVSRKRFKEMIENNELIEWAHVYDDFKGVPKARVEEAFESSKDVLMRLDVQGAEKIRKLYPEAVLIFLLPDSEEEWYRRIEAREGGRPKDLGQRIEAIQKELKMTSLFDYLVVNADGKLQETVDTIVAIINTEHQRTIPRSIKP